VMVGDILKCPELPFFNVCVANLPYQVRTVAAAILQVIQSFFAINLRSFMKDTNWQCEVSLLMVCVSKN